MFNGLRKLIRNFYEAAQPSNPRRSWLPAFVRDARFDANSFSRWELVRKIRYFERNLWLIGKLRKTLVKYTVCGPVTPASADPVFNKNVAREFAKWCQRPFVNSNMNMRAGKKQIAGRYHVEGEIFVHLTNFKTKKTQSVPALRLYESHQCSNQGSYIGSTEADQYVDGVKINSDGLPIAYSIQTGENWIDIPADDIIHVAELFRPGMYRALTPYAETLCTAHDLDDLTMLEMDRAKQIAAVANVVKTRTGEFDASAARQNRFKKPINSERNLNEDQGERTKYFTKVFGSRTIALNVDEEFKQAETTQPSAATQWYWKFLISQVCSSQEVPMILILPESIQGTVARGLYDDADLSFKSKSEVLAACDSEIYLFWLAWAVVNIKSLQDPPGDYQAHHVSPPRAVNVDVGRNSAAMLAELAAGTTNFDAIAAASGTDAETLIRRKAKNIKMVKAIAAEEGIDPSEIMAPLANVIGVLAQAELAKAQAGAAENQAEEKTELVEA